MTAKQLFAIVVLIVVVAAETYRPFFPSQQRSWRDRLWHDGRNFFLATLNAVLSAAIVVWVLVSLDRWAEANHIGLLRQFAMPAWLGGAIALLLFDLWMYWWHRLNHRIGWLWRFHRVHHCDPAMNASTGVRFHFGEVFLSWLARLIVLPLLGMSITQLAAYESAAFAVVVFHHSNLHVPWWVDRLVNCLVVTPAMHRVHHSRLREETNSNYSSLFPWWDRLFQSLKVRNDLENIEYGLDDGLSDPEWQSVTGLIRMPLAGETNSSTKSGQ
ncbi:sterol desaturase family protein [Adhaeretor mobilis]|uniref:Fatty acid hydroxylase superfamily protein n=1 Tax=Adhaeretor mobilis TaxID=1930276 RepID=A0A517MZ37_9BACT|nr:sterol desaturase family protein [Adhaeretor mobilis]QDT00137.1 Fatty acid hydroxylase superfamily protein [Adhaeretor mobilis]